MIRLSRIDPLSKQFQNEFIEAMCWNIYPNASLECIVLWQNNLSCLLHEIRAQNNEIQFNYLAYNIHEFKFSEHIRTQFKLRKCCMRLAFWYWIDFQMFDKNSQLDGTVDMAVLFAPLLNSADFVMGIPSGILLTLSIEWWECSENPSINTFREFQSILEFNYCTSSMLVIRTINFESISNARTFENGLIKIIDHQWHDSNRKPLTRTALG